MRSIPVKLEYKVLNFMAGHNQYNWKLEFLIISCMISQQKIVLFTYVHDHNQLSFFSEVYGGTPSGLTVFHFPEGDKMNKRKLSQKKR